MSVAPSFAQSVERWQSIPLDDVGYFDSMDLLKMPDEEFARLVGEAQYNRYYGWRNYKNAWRRTFKFNTTKGKNVLDYGCGAGIEALQYASKNTVTVADINPWNVKVAQRTAQALFGREIGRGVVIERRGGLLDFNVAEFDVIHCAGVLHHISYPESVMRSFHRWLAPDGEVRLMLYSDRAWKIATGEDPPDEILPDPNFEKYWTFWDPHGGYADWYDEARIAKRFPQFEIVDYQYLSKNEAYVGVILRPRW